MANQQLLDYIKQQLQQGMNREQIKNSLAQNGWRPQDIEEGFNAAGSSVSSGQNPFSVKPAMTTWKIIVASLIGIAIIGGGIYFATQKLFKLEKKSKLPNEQTQQLPKVPVQETPMAAITLDCKQNFDCFIQASQDCKMAKVDYTVATDIFGIKQTTESFFEIKGAEANKCAFYLRTEKIDLVFPSTMPSEVASQQKEIYKKLEGRTGNCKFITSDLTAMLTRWKQGNLSTEDFKAAECSGTYFEQPSQQNDIQNANCHLQISFGSMIINGQKTETIKTSQSMSVGVGTRAYVIGYQGQLDQVSWKSSSDAIAKIEPGQDGTALIKSINPGKAVITVTDNSTNPPCASTINWESTQ